MKVLISAVLLSLSATGCVTAGEVEGTLSFRGSDFNRTGFIKGNGTKKPLCVDKASALQKLSGFMIKAQSSEQKKHSRNCLTLQKIEIVSTPEGGPVLAGTIKAETSGLFTLSKDGKKIPIQSKKHDLNQYLSQNVYVATVPKYQPTVQQSYDVVKIFTLTPDFKTSP